MMMRMVTMKMTMLMMDRVVIVPLVRVMMKRHVRRKAMILMVVITNTVPKRMRMIVIYDPVECFLL